MSMITQRAPLRPRLFFRDAPGGTGPLPAGPGTALTHVGSFPPGSYVAVSDGAGYHVYRANDVGYDPAVALGTTGADPGTPLDETDAHGRPLGGGRVSATSDGARAGRAAAARARATADRIGQLQARFDRHYGRTGR
jgi:hypothetical protein